ncbi:MAG: DUF4124 domain-containing protein [Nevskiales bacterium]
MSKLAIVVIGAGLLLVSVAAAAEVYRWVDAEGEVHYGDRPVQGAQEVQVKTPDSGETAATSPESAAAQSARAQQCELARKRLNEYEKSDALIQEDEFGRRREIRGEERVQLIVRAQSNVKDYCSDQASAETAPAAGPPAEAAPTQPTATDTTPSEPAPAQPAAATGY